MKTILLILLSAVSLFSSNGYTAGKTPLSSHGIDYPQGWQTWSSIAVSHRTDNNTVRAILGNDVAIKAARSGEHSPWPDGAILAKVVWKAGELAHWPKAIGPKDFVHAEFMFKDSVKYADTYGWGWARWVGAEQTPFEGGMQVCVSCHTPVKDNDWVFTEPGWFPTN
ncbi:cytochrome P460 family protein [Shewanella psychrotolerans]|uniref:cytochrome P460 family protein n=1 Tax=Shewanella psychrotolerans TaxID=2864206 RepID=UPI001C661C81|nr:cytochrome P460 family protein [Shewanella psychrotolerans]QYK00235.1 cytochrome P460 family protein [Shewanella psychrotolerans]